VSEQNVFSGSLIRLFSSIVASICWGVFGMLWPALATTDMLVYIAYLWYALAIIFAVFAVYIGMRMLGSIFETKTTPILTLRYNENEE
jgi:hypothetical protein